MIQIVNQTKYGLQGKRIIVNSFRKWLKDNDFEMYSVHNEGKAFVAERFIKTLKRLKSINT